MLDINIFRKAPFGKLYKTRDGRKAIFVGRKSKYLYYLIIEGSPKYLTYFEYGRRFEDNDSNELSDFDIVGDWDFTIKKEKFHIPNEVKEVQEETVSKELNMSARCFGFQNSEALFSFRLPAKAYLVGSEVKISIKQE